MARVIATTGADSFEDGPGTLASIPTPSGVLTDDFYVLSIGSSLNGGTGAAITTPTGWTLHDDNTTGELRGYVFYRRALADGELIPDFTLSASREWSSTCAVVRGVDYTGGPLGNTAESLTSIAPNITTSGTNSIVLMFMAKERRETIGITQGTDRYNQYLAITQLTGTSEGNDNSNSLVVDLEPVSGATINGVTFLGSGGDDSCWTIEILGDGTEWGTYLVDAVKTPIASSAYSIGSDDTWRDNIADSGVILDETSQATWTFDAATDVDPTLDEITLTSHAIPEARVVRADANGNTLPTGITDGNYYYISPVDANTVTLRDADGEATVTSDWYNDDLTPKATINITADGTGTCQFVDVGIFWSEISSVGLTDRAAKSHVAGASNFWGDGIKFSSARDMTGEVFTFLQTSASGSDLSKESMAVFVDSAGDWKSFLISDIATESINGAEGSFTQINPANTIFHKEGGTFDETAVLYVIFLIKLVNGTARPKSIAFLLPPEIAAEIQISGGLSTDKLDWSKALDHAVKVAGAIASQPSDLQFVPLLPIRLGSGALVSPNNYDLYFSDTEKSIAFPPLANGTTLLKNYVPELGLSIDLSDDSEVKINNSQIGASAPFPFNIDGLSDVAADLEMDGVTLVEGTATLISGQTINRVLFVGGEGITHNDAIMNNCVFNNVSRAAGYLILTTTNNISDATFQTDTPADYAIEIDTAGTYAFDNFTFTGFTTDINVTETTGTVTINISGGGDTPTTTTAGATVIVNNSVGVKVTAKDAGDATNIQSARVLLSAATGGDLPFEDSVTITRVTTTATVTHTAHGLVTGNKISISGANESEYNGIKTITVTGANDYTYTVSGSPTTPATGTIIGTSVILDGDTSASGVVEDTGFNFTTDQPVEGRIRKGASSPLYKTGIILGTINSSGFDVNIFLVDDE